MSRRALGVYAVCLLVFVACCALWPQVVAGVYAVSGGLMLLALVVHLIRQRLFPKRETPPQRWDRGRRSHSLSPNVRNLR